MSMEDFEFKKYSQMIEDQKDVASSFKTRLLANTSPLLDLLNSVIENTEKRNALLKSYADDINNFETSGNLVKPSDLFLGVRTATDMADPEELKAVTDKMKADASEIERLEKLLEKDQNMLIKLFKDTFGDLREYLIQNNSIYDMSIDLLNKLDSIYDVAQIARNS